MQVAGCRLQVASQNLKNPRTVNAKVKTHEQPDFKASNIQTKTELLFGLRSDAVQYIPGGGGESLEGSLGVGEPPRPSNPDPV